MAVASKTKGEGETDVEAPPAAAAAVGEGEAGAPSEQAAAAPATEKAGSKRPRPADFHIADELSFPAASIARIVKACIPDNMQLAKDARTAFARSASIFALYVTACANDICREGKRSTISANDVFKALDELEFETFTPQVKEFVEAFRAAQAAKKGSAPEGDDAAAEDGADEAEGSSAEGELNGDEDAELAKEAHEEIEVC